MSLQYPDEWKFGEFEYEIPPGAHRAFMDLVGTIVEGQDRPKAIFEDFKTAFGDNSNSSDASWAESDLWRAMGNMRGNAARYVAAFYNGRKAVKDNGVAVPPINAINKILAQFDVPLAIEDGELVLTAGDIELVESEYAETPESRPFALGPKIGGGSFGAVYKVTRKTAIGEYHYAMKLLDPSVFIENKERAKTRFIREMKALEKLQHRGIVPLLEAGFDNSRTPYILMPLVEGEVLDKALSGADPRQVYVAFDEILRALAFAHEKNVIHRDLKPRNILIRAADSQPIILDFGCAFFLDEIDPTLTTQLIGTPGYVPEEVYADPRHRDVRQDIYACGAMLYQVIVGKLPRLTRYEPIEELLDGFKGIDKVILAALAPEEDRTETADIMREQLAAIAAKG